MDIGDSRGHLNVEVKRPMSRALSMADTLLDKAVIRACRCVVRLCSAFTSSVRVSVVFAILVSSRVFHFYTFHVSVSGLQGKDQDHEIGK